MLKKELEQRWARKPLRETLSIVEKHVGKLEGSMKDIKESLDGVKDPVGEERCSQGHGDGFERGNNGHDDGFEHRIEELEVELVLCRAAVGKGVSSAAVNKKDVPKLTEFVGIRSACDVDNFLWMMENYFCAKDITNDAVKIGTCQELQCELKRQFYLEFIEEKAQAKLQEIMQRGTMGEYVREFKELMLQFSNGTEKEALLAFQNGLKPWVRHEVEQRGVQKLSEAMSIAESVVKLGLEKDKIRSSKFEERSICEKNHKEDVIDGKGNGDNSVNGKARVGKKKPNGNKLKCFLYDVSHMLKKCPKKSVLKKKSVGKALVLGLSARGVEAKEAKSEKKPVKCFLCHGPHRLRKCPKKSVIEGDNGVDKEPKKLGSSKGKLEARRAKRSKKKQVKCFLCRGLHELRNCPKQVVVKGKPTSELGESSEGLPPKEEVSLLSNLGEKVMMKTVKLGAMRLSSSEALEFVESSTRLPPMGKVSGASGFKGKEVMQVGELARVNATSRLV
ncbi:hypothetical protein Goshw_007482 [Gossypium schwendimanii]|uniref:Retrotransposon gag domain-containing protein n=1 Tax=Gossypium schwendimanii TaxID=34291 RepID=A0A7J9L1R2_GOSSC|nr:hypothetical protein [Gossypium schwendimanii]